MPVFGSSACLCMRARAVLASGLRCYPGKNHLPLGLHPTNTLCAGVAGKGFVISAGDVREWMIGQLYRPLVTLSLGSFLFTGRSKGGGHHSMAD